MLNPLGWRRIQAGQAGMHWWPVLGAAALISVIYRWVVSIRNRIYDRRGPVVCLDVPVISVGNITTGGTGKTPMVIDLITRVESFGRSVAVVARGYGAVAGAANDEERLIRRHCPSAVYVANPDRAAGSTLAMDRYGANAVILDDGFQHRRLGRDLDIVLIDATCPFGFNYLLPRGLLREPLLGLKRADVIVLSRCDQVSATQLNLLEKKLASLVPTVPRVRAVHLVVGVQTLAGEDIDYVDSGKRAVVFGGVGHPEAFVTTVRSLDIEVVGEYWWPDHHHYRSSDVNALMRLGRFPSHDFLLTTEKDAVKLSDMKGIQDVPIGVVKITIDFTDGGDTIMQQLLEEVLQES